jgi:nucleotide-binding universal stress UspA family protein
MHWLLYVDGTALAEEAVRFAAPLAAAAGAEATLLAAAATPADEPAARAAAEHALGRLPGAHVLVRPGRGVHALLDEAGRGRYDALVVGSRGRRGWQRMAFGSVAARMARYSPVPVLIVKGRPRPALRRMLACSAGGRPAEAVARWAGYLGGLAGAEVTMLHVMSQLALSAEAPLRPLTESAEEAMAEQTREGQHLAGQLAAAAAAAGPAGVHMRPRLRHGLVVDEVAAEAAEGDYDLLVIGGHQAPPVSEGWGPVRTHLLEDVADQIIMAVQRPILVVKGARELHGAPD